MQKWHQAKERKFQRGNNVNVHNFSDNTWIPDVIEKLNGPLSYHIKLQDDCIVQ